MIFYTPVAHPQGSNWFAIHSRGGASYISNGISATIMDFYAVEADNGDIIYARGSWSITSPDKSVCIGFNPMTGRNRITYWGEDRIDPNRIHLLKIQKDQLVDLSDPTSTIDHLYPSTDMIYGD